MKSGLTIGTLILAAGESSRLGQPKQLIVHRGETLLGRAAATALSLGAGPVCVVLGSRAETIRSALAGLDLIVVENQDWREGMGTSLSSGIRELLRVAPALDGILIMLCDQPLISVSTLRTLANAHWVTGKAIAAAEYAGTLGVPAFFARPLFAELLALRGGEGARSILQRHRKDATGVPVPEAAIDIDTVEDLIGLSRE